MKTKRGETRLKGGEGRRRKAFNHSWNTSVFPTSRGLRGASNRKALMIGRTLLRQSSLAPADAGPSLPTPLQCLSSAQASNTLGPERHAHYNSQPIRGSAVLSPLPAWSIEFSLSRRAVFGCGGSRGRGRRRREGRKGRKLQKNNVLLVECRAKLHATSCHCGALRQGPRRGNGRLPWCTKAERGAIGGGSGGGGSSSGRGSEIETEEEEEEEEEEGIASTSRGRKNKERRQGFPEAWFRSVD